jgi:hypothetical protein
MCSHSNTCCSPAGGVYSLDINVCTDLDYTSELEVDEEDNSDISIVRDYYSAIYGIGNNLLSENTINVSV